MKTPQLNLMSYDDILEYAISAYIIEFGEDKYKTVINKVISSKKISKFINSEKYKDIPPVAMDFIYCLNEIPFFIFSRGQTQAVAALIALQKWNEEINYHKNLLSVEELRLIAINILDKTRKSFF